MVDLDWQDGGESTSLENGSRKPGWVWIPTLAFCDLPGQVISAGWRKWKYPLYETVVRWCCQVLSMTQVLNTASVETNWWQCESLWSLSRFHHWHNVCLAHGGSLPWLSVSLARNYGFEVNSALHWLSPVSHSFISSSLSLVTILRGGGRWGNRGDGRWWDLSKGTFLLCEGTGLVLELKNWTLAMAW